MRRSGTPIIFCITSLLFVIQSFNVKSQQSIDSLKSCLLIESDNYELANIYYEIADYYYNNSYDSGLYYAEKYLEASKFTNDSSWIADAYNFIAYVYDQYGDIRQTANYFKKALEIYLELDDQYQVAYCYNNLGYVVSYGADQPAGLSYLLKSMQIAEVLKDSILVSSVSCNIAYFYERLKDYNTAYDFYKRSLDYNLVSGDSFSLAMDYGNMALINLKLENYNEVEISLTKSRAYINDQLSPYDLVFLYTTYMDTYLEWEKIDSVRLYIPRTEKILNENEFLLISAYVTVQKGVLCFLEKDYWKSIQLLTQGLNKYSEIGVKEPFSVIYTKIAFAYAQLGLYDQAYKAEVESSENLDSLNYGAVAAILSRNEQEKIGKIQLEKSTLEFELEKNNLENDAYHSQMNLKITLISLGLILLLVGVIIYFLIKLQNKNRALYNQNEMIKENYELLQISIDKVRKSEEELKKLNATRDKFFSIIAHDLRTPLSSIIGLSDLFMKGNLGSDSKEMIKIMESMKSTANYGFNLLENLLEWAISNTGEMSPKPVKIDLCELIQIQLKGIKEIAEKKGIKIKFLQEDRIFIFADENMLSVIIRNLIHNAIKFSYQNGTIQIGFTKENDKLLIYIEDHGIGISKSELKHMFKNELSNSRFGTNSEKGSGLGLILCKDFIEKNNGKIWVESEENVGSKFIFTLPLYKDK